LAGQPLVLVLDQLEQRGLDLLDVGDLGEHELAVLTRGLDGQPAGAQQPVDQPVGERHVADPVQREVPPGPGQDAPAQPEPAGGELVGGGAPAQQRDQEPEQQHGHHDHAHRDPGWGRPPPGGDDHQQYRGGQHHDDEPEDRPEHCFPVRVHHEHTPLAVGELVLPSHSAHRDMEWRSSGSPAAPHPDRMRWPARPRRRTQRRCTTSPAPTSSRPDRVCTASRPVASTSCAMPVSSPPPGSSTRTGWPTVAHQPRYSACSQAASGSAAHARYPRASRVSTAVSSSSRSVLAAPDSSSEVAAGSGSSAWVSVTLRPNPATIAPPCASARIPAIFRPPTSTSLGHFSRAGTAASSRSAAATKTRPSAAPARASASRSALVDPVSGRTQSFRHSPPGWISRSRRAAASSGGLPTAIPASLMTVP